LASFYFWAMQKRGLLLYFSLFISFYATGQGDFKQSFSDQLHIRLSPDIQRSYYSFKQKEIGEKLIFQPNNPVKLSIAGNYNNIGLGVSILKLAQKSKRTHGNSNGIQVFGEAFRKAWMGSIQFQRFKGLYSERHPSTLINANPTLQYVRPDISTFLVTASASYFFNSDKYSLKAPINATEMQLKSAGSFLVSFAPEYFKISGDSGFIYNNLQTTPNLYSLAEVIFRAGAGYAYTYVYDKHIYINGLVVPSLGLSLQRLKYNTEKNLHLYLPFQLMLSSTVGYQTTKYFFGVSPQYYWQAPNEITNKYTVEKEHLRIRAFVGMRF